MNIDKYLDQYNETKDRLDSSNVSNKMKDMISNNLLNALQKIHEDDNNFDQTIYECNYYLDIMLIQWKKSIE